MPKIDLVKELRAQGTTPRNYVADLSGRAADEIDRLRSELMRLTTDRQYVHGFNEGWDAALENEQKI